MRRTISRITDQGYVSEQSTPEDAARLMEMLETRSVPRIDTDSTFMSGHPRLGDKRDEKSLKSLIRQARKHGYNPSPNDVYFSPIAAFPGDPKAFVSQAGGKYQVKKRCQELGLHCEGAVNVKGAEVAPPKPDVPLAADLMNEAVVNMVRKDPGLKRKPLRELQEAAIDKHGYKPKR
jgi:hypothetical protein